MGLTKFLIFSIDFISKCWLALNAIRLTNFLDVLCMYYLFLFLIILCSDSSILGLTCSSKLKASKGLTAGTPFDVAHSSGCQLRGQSCYVEITMGCSSKCSDKTLESDGYGIKNVVQHHSEEAQITSAGRSQQKQGSPYQLASLQRTFVYQPETVVVPLLHRAFARTSLKRCQFFLYYLLSKICELP